MLNRLFTTRGDDGRTFDTEMTRSEGSEEGAEQSVQNEQQVAVVNNPDKNGCAYNGAVAAYLNLF